MQELPSAERHYTVLAIEQGHDAARAQILGKMRNTELQALIDTIMKGYPDEEDTEGNV